MYCRKIFLFLLLLISGVGSAQNFGGFPPSTRWRQINSDTARIIYNAPAKYQAERILSIINKMAAQQEQGFGHNLKKINIVLHTNTTLANGYVALAPFRSEFYLIPGGDIFQFGTLPWYEQLAVHEYRHVQQYNNFNVGIAKAANVIFGQEGRALFNALAVTDWFFEGDAVYAETALTPQGRGKTPYFFNGFKSLWREGREYSWMKLRNGSFKDYVPNHYELGYLLVNYGYLKYGDDFWSKVTNDAARFKALFNPFNTAIKRYSGENFRTFRRHAFDYYKHQVSKRRTDETKRETVTNYYFPQYINEDSIIYLKTAYNKLPAFYIKTKNDEQRIALRNITSEEWFSYRNGTIAYTAYDVNARWSLKDYSNIVLLDIYTKKERKLTEDGKYFTPDISPSGNSIVSVFVNDSAQSELHFLDSKTGEVKRKFKTAEGSFFVQPRFIDEQTIAVFERLPNSTLVLNKIDVAGKVERLIEPMNTTMGNPFIYNNTIYFTASFSGNDDIYAMQLKDKKIYQLSSGQTGRYFPSVFKDSLIFSQFTSNGLHLQTEALSKLPKSEMNQMVMQESALPFAVANSNDTTNILRTATRNFTDVPYKGATGLFNYHSWRPDYLDPEFTFSLNSDNILSTFSNQVYYTYNQNERSHGLGFNAAYAGLFPVLTAGVEYTYNRHFVPEDFDLTLDQLEVQGGFYIPLNFTEGKTLKGLTFGSNYVFNRLIPTGALKDLNNPINSSYLNHFLSWNQRLPRAVQHIFPKFGYNIATNYKHRMEENGFQFLNNGNLYLPSFGNHSIVLNGSYQVTDTNNVNTGYFSNQFSNSRGYIDYNASKMWKASANYHLPLFYPDWGFANALYILRVRGNVFYDHTRYFENKRNFYTDLRSTGAELLFDINIWNALPLSIGVRYSYLLDHEKVRSTNKSKFEVILPLDLIPN